MRSAVISKSILSWGHRISIFRVNYLVDGRGFLAVPPSRSVVSREFFLLHSPFAYLRWTLVDRQKQKRWWRRRQKQVAPGEKSYCIEWPQTMSVLIFILLRLSSRFTAILMDGVLFSELRWVPSDDCYAKGLTGWGEQIETTLRYNQIKHRCWMPVTDSGIANSCIGR